MSLARNFCYSSIQKPREFSFARKPSMFLTRQSLPASVILRLPAHLWRFHDHRHTKNRTIRFESTSSKSKIRRVHLKTRIALVILGCLTLLAHGAVGQQGVPAGPAGAAQGQRPAHRRYPTSRRFRKDITRAELTAKMREFNGALGVQCTFCHAQDPATQRTDFASDANPHKDMARVMITMTAISTPNISPSSASIQPSTPSPVAPAISDTKCRLPFTAPPPARVPVALVRAAGVRRPASSGLGFLVERLRKLRAALSKKAAGITPSRLLFYLSLDFHRDRYEQRRSQLDQLNSPRSIGLAVIELSEEFTIRGTVFRDRPADPCGLHVVLQGHVLVGDVPAPRCRSPYSTSSPSRW